MYINPPLHHNSFYNKATSQCLTINLSVALATIMHEINTN